MVPTSNQGTDRSAAFDILKMRCVLVEIVVKVLFEPHKRSSLSLEIRQHVSDTDLLLALARIFRERFTSASVSVVSARALEPHGALPATFAEGRPQEKV